MKKVLFVTALLCAALGAVSAQNRLPDLEAYFAAANQLTSPKWDFENRPFRGEEATDTARFGNLTGNLNYIDSYLGFALLTYYSEAEKPWAERGNAILPLNNPRLVDRQLGAMVVKELAELKFLDPKNTAAIGRYEGMLTFIAGRNGVTRTEIDAYYRQAIGQLVAETIINKFSKVSFTITVKGKAFYDAELAFNPKTRECVLNYDGNIAVENDEKKLSASSLDALLSAISSSPDFNQSSAGLVREKFAQIPVVSKIGQKTVEPTVLITEILTGFYTAQTPPDKERYYKALLGMYRRYFSLNVRTPTISSLMQTVKLLSPALADKFQGDRYGMVAIDPRQDNSDDIDALSRLGNAR